jgi:hypothetical protein
LTFSLVACIALHPSPLASHSPLPFQEGVNRFSDMTPEEFGALLGYKKELGRTVAAGTYGPGAAHHKASPGAGLTAAALPTSVDWRQKGAVTPVKDRTLALASLVWLYAQ